MLIKILIKKGVVHVNDQSDMQSSHDVATTNLDGHYTVKAILDPASHHFHPDMKVV